MFLLVRSVPSTLTQVWECLLLLREFFHTAFLVGRVFPPVTRRASRTSSWPHGLWWNAVVGHPGPLPWGLLLCHFENPLFIFNLRKTDYNRSWNRLGGLSLPRDLWPSVSCIAVSFSKLGKSAVTIFLNVVCIHGSLNFLMNPDRLNICSSSDSYSEAFLLASWFFFLLQLCVFRLTISGCTNSPEWSVLIWKFSSTF